jgi:hypothetical protein
MPAVLGVEDSVPLLRSKNDSKYRIDTAGRSLRSSFLSSFLSLIDLGTISTSKSDIFDAAGASCFSKAIVGVSISKIAIRDRDASQHLRGTSSSYHRTMHETVVASMMQECGFSRSTRQRHGKTRTCSHLWALIGAQSGSPSEMLCMLTHLVFRGIAEGESYLAGQVQGQHKGVYKDS